MTSSQTHDCILDHDRYVTIFLAILSGSVTLARAVEDRSLSDAIARAARKAALEIAFEARQTTDRERPTKRPQ